MRRRPLGEDASAGGLQQQHKRQRADDSTRVFVGSLSYSTDWQSLKDHFSQAGEVEFASVLVKPDGSSKGCGMVNFRTAEDAARAVEELNETMLDGRHIMVKLDGVNEVKRPPAQPPPQRPVPVALPTPQEEGVRLPPEHISRVFVGSLAFSTTWQGLKDHFKAAGNVEFASVLENPDKTSKGVGLVNFPTHEEAVNAVELLHETVLDGRQITVKLDVDGRFKERPPPKSQQSPALEEEQLYYTLPPDKISRVFVGNLSYDTNWQALKDHFSQIGEIEFASVLLNHDRTSKGVGMVNFRNHREAVRAVDELNNSLLDGRHIAVKLDVDGHFKERPPPGARPRVFQRPRGAGAEEAAAGVAALQALGGAAVLTQALTRAGYAAPAPQRSAPAAGVSSLRGSASGGPQSTATTLDCLNALGRLAQSPVAGQIDWPALISSVAATVSSASSGPRRG